MVVVVSGVGVGVGVLIVPLTGGVTVCIVPLLEKVDEGGRDVSSQVTQSKQVMSCQMVGANWESTKFHPVMNESMNRHASVLELKAKAPHPLLAQIAAHCSALS